MIPEKAGKTMKKVKDWARIERGLAKCTG